MGNNKDGKDYKKDELRPFERYKKWMAEDEIVLKIKKSLPDTMSIDPDAWIETALTAMGSDADIRQCTAMSMLGATKMAAGLGLRFEGPLGQAYLERRGVYEGKGRDKRLLYHEVQLQVGYRGLLDMMYRTPDVRDIEVFAIHRNDKLEMRRGSKPYIGHSWDHTKPKEARGVESMMVTGIRYKDGYYSFETYPWEDLVQHRLDVLAGKGIGYNENTDKFYYTNGGNEIDRLWTSQAWIKYPMPMFKKTAIRMAAKYWNLSGDIQQAANLVELGDAGISQGLEQIGRGMLSPGEKIIDNASVPNAGILGGSQSASLTQGTALGKAMLAEATRGQQPIGNGCDARQPGKGPASPQGSPGGKKEDSGKRSKKG